MGQLRERMEADLKLAGYSPQIRRIHLSIPAPCRPLGVRSRTTNAVNRVLVWRADPLNALSRSRHFRPSESAVEPEIGSSGPARRSQVQRQRAGSLRRSTRKSF
jgi:hypothetical protein